MAYFPMMINLKDRFCLVVGGGIVAFRKVKVLRQFGARVTVEASEICKEIEEIPNIYKCRKDFESTDLKDVFLVVAATDDRQTNQKISRLCRERGILVNAVDQPEDCDFIFPSYLKEGDVVAAFSSGGNSPVLTQYLKEKNRTIVTAHLGEIADALGTIRDEVKSMTATEQERKKICQNLLLDLLNTDDVPESEELLNKIKER